MCGIFGAVFEKNVDISGALARLRHRGPDSHDTFRADRVVLGHTRLAVLDLSQGGAQPMTSADGTAVVVFNGEIYNHHALRRELLADGCVFRSRSDTEVIVEGYRAHGESFFERLDGMFAFGLFDLNARKLFLARDRIGKKPLFYVASHGRLRFASEIRALFASGIDARIRTQSLAPFLTLGYVPPPATLYDDVMQLPPASILEVHEGGEPRIRRYWRARFEPLANIRQLRAPDVEGELRRLLRAAVRRRLEADVPLGAFLSGGLDSSIVVGLMSRESAGRVKTFSIGFAGDRRFDETMFARCAAKAFGTDHTEFTLEPQAFDSLDALVEAHDGPFGDSSAIPTAVVSMLTRRHVTVALTGDGGDELFAGYARFRAAAASERVPAIVRAALVGLSERLPTGVRLVDRVKRIAQVAASPLPDRMLRWQSYFTVDLGNILRAEVHEEVDLHEARRWLDRLDQAAGKSTPLGRTLAINFDSYLPYDLLVKADRCSMLHSLELRSPFLDTALVEFAARLPDRFRIRNGRTKWILRRAFADLLPPSIMRRGKMGFGMPLATWFRTSLRGFVRDTLNGSAKIGTFLNLSYVNALLDEHESGRRDHQHAIWLLLTMERWLHLLPSWTSEGRALPEVRLA